MSGRTRAIDQHVRDTEAARGLAVGYVSRRAWCRVHATNCLPCAACAGDHAAGEHAGHPVTSCARCTRWPS